MTRRSAHAGDLGFGVARLAPQAVARYRETPVNHAAGIGPHSLRDGATLPRGYRRFSETSAPIEGSLDALATLLLTWQVQRRSGFTVAASASPLCERTVVEMHLGPRLAAFRIPCRVTTVIDEPDRRGFIYETLRGHPEAGLESFVLDRLPDGRVTFTVTAVSRPGTWLTRLGAPLLTQIQRAMTARYLRVLL